VFGGGGGDGFLGANGGAGASEALVNATSATSPTEITVGPHVSSGPGGDAFGGGAGGAGGSASAIQTVNSGTTSQVDAGAFAIGAGGGRTDTGTPGAGGAAYAKLTLISAPSNAEGIQTVDGGVSASGGPPGAGGTETGIGGDAMAIVNVTTTGGTGFSTAFSSSVVGGTATSDAHLLGASNGFALSQSTTNEVGERVSAKANSPAGSLTSAETQTSMTPAQIQLVEIAPGLTAANAALAPAGPTVGSGAMSIGYGGDGSSIEYQAEESFSFSTTTWKTLEINFISDEYTGKAFDVLTIILTINGSIHNYTFNSISDANYFFNNNLIDYKYVNGIQNIDLVEDFTSSESNSGFGFAYDIKLAPAPEPSTWAMVLVGFAGLAFAGHRRAKPGRTILAG
jgi:hypothetical protein